MKRRRWCTWCGFVRGRCAHRGGGYSQSHIRKLIREAQRRADAR